FTFLELLISLTILSLVAVMVYTALNLGTRAAALFFFKQKTAYEVGLGIPAEPLFRSLAAERPLKDIRDEYNYPKKKGIKDECSRLLEASTMKSRRGFAIQRLMNAMRQAHADGWFIVFDTLTLADDRLEAFYDNPN